MGTRGSVKFCPIALIHAIRVSVPGFPSKQKQYTGQLSTHQQLKLRILVNQSGSRLRLTTALTLLEKEGSREPEVHLQGAPQMRLQEVDLGFQGDSPGVFKQVLDFTRSIRELC